VGEFGEMLINGTCKNPDGNPLIVPENEILDIYDNVLKDHNKKGDRSDIVIMWTLTALSKLSIRLTSDASTMQRIKEAIKEYENHVNVEI